MSGVRQRKGAGAKEDATKGQSADSGEKEKITKLIEELAGKAPEKCQPYVKQAAPFLAAAWVAFQIALPYIIQFVQIVSKFVSKLPEKVIYASLGIAVCFFGGVFPATIAAVEAWRLCGGEEAWACCKELWAEFMKVQKASAEDDAKDDDGDGVPDVKQVSAKELIARKGVLALKATDPKKVNTAIACLYTGWVGVLATLQIQFAKTVTLGEVIGQKLYGVAAKAEPALEKMCPDDYQKWVPVVTRWACKAVAISAAWWIQRVISAVHSAIRGGFMCAKYLVEFAEEKKPGCMASLGPMASEIVGWSVAACGLLFQFMFGFSVPFPFSLLTWPLNIVEWFIVWSVSSQSSPSF